MSDLRRHGVCIDCGYWISGTSAVDWAAEHMDVESEHRVVLTQSGDLSDWREEPPR